MRRDVLKTRNTGVQTRDPAGEKQRWSDSENVARLDGRLVRISTRSIQGNNNDVHRRIDELRL